MELPTKTKILYAALDMFSKNGYEGTNLRDLASTLDISKSALYKHYTSKEDIFNSLIDEIEAYYQKEFNKGINKDEIITLEKLKEISLAQLSFTMQDELIIKVRKLFTIEQYRNEKIAKLASKHFVYDIEHLYEELFTKMIEDNIIEDIDPKLLSYEYFAPISLLLQLVDREPNKKDEALLIIEKHIDNFIERYGKK